MDPYTEKIFECSFQDEAVEGSFVIEDLKIYGLAKTGILSIRPIHENKKFTLEIDLEIPKTLIDGNYFVEGVIGQYKLGGKGTFKIIMKQCFYK